MRLAVCYQHVDPARGGAETYVTDLCGALVRMGHSVDLLAETCAGDLKRAGVTWRRVPAIGHTSLGRLWNFAIQCETAVSSAQPAYDCSIGLINTWGQDILIPQGGVRVASLEANAARFKHAFARSIYRMAKRSNLKWWVYRAIEARQYDPHRRTQVVAVSRMVAGHLRTYHGLDAERVSVIPNAIDPKRFESIERQRLRDELRSQLGLQAHDVVALFTGHNFRLKGLGPLLDALELNRRNNPHACEIHVLVCGGGKAAAFRRQAQRLGIADFVHFAGFVADVRACYFASDFFVLPTFYDPCSLVVFEALACGLPVITTRCNGAGELITPGLEGDVIESPHHIDQLAVALNRLADASTRQTASTHAIRLGRRQSLERHVESLLTLAAQVSERRGQTSRTRTTTSPGHFHIGRHDDASVPATRPTTA
jgi:UDP-glucose:(heptosyl)LPS alpha-1,3-glucosyltransferase